MAGSFPAVSGAFTTQSGVTHSLVIRTAIEQFRAGTEQRYALSGLLNQFKLTYSNLSWSELSAIRDHFVIQKGAFDATWTLDITDPSTLAVRTYNDLAFDTDDFSYQETKPRRYSVSLPAVQTAGETVTVAPAMSFPALATGATVQLPATVSSRFTTFRNDLEAGKRISYYAWTDPLRRWPLIFPLITDAELQTYVQFYLGQGGPLTHFAFTDPDTGTTYDYCRFASSPIEITRLYRGCNKLSLVIEQYQP